MQEARQESFEPQGEGLGGGNIRNDSEPKIDPSHEIVENLIHF